jgi:hypothetical protein
MPKLLVFQKDLSHMHPWVSKSELQICTAVNYKLNIQNNFTGWRLHRTGLDGLCHLTPDWQNPQRQDQKPEELLCHILTVSSVVVDFLFVGMAGGVVGAAIVDDSWSSHELQTNLLLIFLHSLVELLSQKGMAHLPRFLMLDLHFCLGMMLSEQCWCQGPDLELCIALSSAHEIYLQLQLLKNNGFKDRNQQAFTPARASRFKIFGLWSKQEKCYWAELKLSFKHSTIFHYKKSISNFRPNKSFLCTVANCEVKHHTEVRHWPLLCRC